MSKEVEPGATGRSGKRGNEVFWTHPTKPGIIIARAISAKIATARRRIREHLPSQPAHGQGNPAGIPEKRSRTERGKPFHQNQHEKCGGRRHTNRSEHARQHE